MNRKDIIFAAIALVVIGLFVFLSLIGREAKPVTARAEHAGVTRDTPRETCWGCHAPDSTVAPMPARHPKKGKPPDTTTPCYACHKLPDETAAFIYLTKTEERTFVWPGRERR
ncbi:MAG: hypothetical protein L0229_19215 [Blastocatellia bacterium]|nr:hypothetical protein [Blastocatellia bacterium]